jgi:hypothetical protein
VWLGHWKPVASMIPCLVTQFALGQAEARCMDNLSSALSVPPQVRAPGSSVDRLRSVGVLREARSVVDGRALREAWSVGKE